MATGDAGEYDDLRSRAAERSRNASRAGREIGPLPEVQNISRRESTVLDFGRYCEIYRRKTFALRWSADHLRMISKIEEVVLRGGRQAYAMCRGFGKTSMCEAAAEWAHFHGHSPFTALIGATDDAADEMLESIKKEIEDNDLLLADFPEVCYPIRCLEGINHRVGGQILDGRNTNIQWTAGEIVLPTVQGSKASGSCIKVAGIVGRVRGMRRKMPDGTSARPRLVIIDDPQTDASARSPAQCQARENVLSKAIMGLGGPNVEIAAIMPCTVIQPGDMADRMLDRAVHPEWCGERSQLVYSFPTDTEIWRQYGELRKDDLRNGDRLTPTANAFYVANRERMDAGCVVAWDEFRKPNELSAIQSAMNLLIDDEDAFWSERQNKPRPIKVGDAKELIAAEVVERLNTKPRWEAPAAATRVTTFVDVQQRLLYYAVCAWAEDFTGWVIDYGSWPDQRKSYYTYRDCNPTIQVATKINSLEGSIFAALCLLGKQIYERRYGTLSPGLNLIDGSWGLSTETVYKYSAMHAPLVMTSHGRGIQAGDNPMAVWAKQQGERRGLNWIVPPLKAGRESRHVTYDSNFWKSFVAARLSMPMGERGALTLFGDKPAAHRLLADHVTAEYSVRTEGRGREIEEWKLKAHKPDNHLLDCLAGCAVAASVLGTQVPDTVAPKLEPVKYSEIQRQKRAARGRRW